MRPSRASHRRAHRLAEAAGRHERAELVAGEAADELQRAEAAAALPGADEALAQAERQINEATQVLSRADETLTNAKKAERDLDVLLLGLVAERERAEERVSGVAATIGEDETLVAGLRAELQALGDSIAAAEAAWGGTEQAARERCDQVGRDATTLRNRANSDLQEALFAIGMRRDEDHAPTDELLAAWRARQSDERDTPFPQLASPLDDEFLAITAEQDEVLRTGIKEDRENIAEMLAACEANVTEERAGVERIQDAIHSLIETAVSDISAQFARLDAEAGGFGARLELEIRPPVNATDKWGWLVTPMWKRTPDGDFVPYTAPTNSAQDKLYTVHLVLAALLAVPDPAGRVLVLDELGDSRGAEHRRDVLRAIAQTAQLGHHRPGHLPGRRPAPRRGVHAGEDRLLRVREPTRSDQPAGAAVRLRPAGRPRRGHPRRRARRAPARLGPASGDARISNH